MTLVEINPARRLVSAMITRAIRDLWKDDLTVSLDALGFLLSQDVLVFLEFLGIDREDVLETALTHYAERKK